LKELTDKVPLIVNMKKIKLKKKKDILKISMETNPMALRL